MINTAEKNKAENRNTRFTKSKRKLMALHISDREAQILRYVSEEYTTNEIAKDLFLSEHTIVTHRKRLMTKMGARNTAGLVRRGFELGLLVLRKVH